MSLVRTLAALAALALLTACNSQADTSDVDGSETAGAEASQTPAPLTAEEYRGEAGASEALALFARAIAQRDTGQAYAMLTARAQQGWSAARFAALFDGLRNISVTAPAGTIEGAAGTSYYTSQATITAQDADGRPVRLEGPIVLRRVNDVPGATAEQLRWMVDSIDLSQTH